MLVGDRILLVDDSRFMLEVLGRVLAPHCAKMLLAGSYRDALRELEQHTDIRAVICDVSLRDGDGFQLLELLACEPRLMPKVLLMAARWSEEERERAMSLGASAYLRKPVSLHDIRSTLMMPANPNPRESRHCTLAKAWIIDPERRERLVWLGIHDISASGALLDSTGPLPVGARLEFEIVYSEDQAVRAKGTVVRVQEPSWLDRGGAAIHFDWVESVQRLNELMRRHDRLRAPSQGSGRSSSPG